LPPCPLKNKTNSTLACKSGSNSAHSSARDTRTYFIIIRSIIYSIFHIYFIFLT
jgi:hypothetical protein